MVSKGSEEVFDPVQLDQEILAKILVPVRMNVWPDPPVAFLA